MSDRLSAMRSALLAVLLPAASALLLAISFPPWDWTWLAWIAIVPFAGAISQRSFVAETYVGSYLGGLVFHLVALDWIRTSYDDHGFSGPWAVCWQLSSLTMAWSWPFALLVGRSVWRWTRLPMSVVLPLAWVVAELARRHAATVVDETGFAWLQLGHTQANRLTLVQVADLGGVYLVTFVVAAANGAIFDVLRWLHAGRRSTSDRVGVLGSFGIAACLLIASLAYGNWRIGQERAVRGPVVCLMPPLSVIDPFTTPWDASDRNDGMSNNGSVPIPRRGIPAGSKTGDLLVWAEGAFDLPLLQPAPHVRANPRDQTILQLERLAHDTRAAVLIGAPREDHTCEPPRRYNSAIFVDPQVGYVGSYDKVCLVPWSEFAPGHGIPFGTRRQTGHFDRGASLTLFKLSSRAGDRQFSLATTICYDVCFPHLFRRYMMTDPGCRPPDFFVGISSEAFDRTNCVGVTHLRMTTFRAIECRRAHVRNVHMGYSGMIDSNGRVVTVSTDTALTEPFFLGSVPVDDRCSPYSQFGDRLLIGVCLVLTIGAVAQQVLMNSRARRHGKGRSSSWTG